MLVPQMQIMMIHAEFYVEEKERIIATDFILLFFRLLEKES